MNETHVTDELELYALGALGDDERVRVEQHLAACPACREQARPLEDVARALPETVPEREVPVRLRARILATAERDLAAAPRGTAWSSWRPGLRTTRLAIAGLTAAVLVLGAIDVSLMRERDELVAERNEYADVALRASHGGQNWYMAGVDAWAGSGGTLYAPAKPDSAAFAVFHDLRPLERGSVYALWLIDGDGKWWRMANFTPNGEQAQAVVLDAPVKGYFQCAVTIETSREGRRAGPVVMQSRIG